MDLLSRIRHDVRLRNLTVYAQWLSLSAILVCCIANIWLLVNTMLFWIHYPQRPLPSVWHARPIVQTLNVIFFPIAPIAVIMPYLSKYHRFWFTLGVIWWCIQPVYYSFVLPFKNDLGNIMMSAQYCFFLIFLAVLPCAPLLKDTYSSNRFIFHIGFTISISFWVGRISFWIPGSILPLLVRPHFEWAAVPAGLAAVLYFIAARKGHGLVFSRTLGGPGVEPMSLALPSLEPEYSAISNGRIRL
ncbi:uncharacterized protein BDZ99DRAFT_58825 [Mytilinidion resinicola]|uniref:Uncharacterized protein n=1 Tax=Mytilinidion resinicola TaxID=574789 RepID=A0A6A6YL40_9PEZI|nr:uncharacterized protein BDZ99DRAFT_58825 [Mytilinidion resinicola]KAF2808587.1 hypothetical protein BDZ99DRAFT_58825 [Mytilinidion resinicola]